MSAVSPNGDVPESPRTATSTEPTAVEVITSVLAKHHPTRGMAVSMGVTCACGEWRQGGRRTPGSDGLDAHRAEVAAAALSAAGYVVATREEIRELQATALREAADDVPLFEFMLVMDIASEIAPAQIRGWLRLRADRLTVAGEQS